jgi:hypothetical protein
MKMALPTLIPTLRSHSTGNHTQVDNIFCTENLMDNIIKCNTDDAARPIKTDHYLIVTQIDIHATKTEWEPRRNFRLTDWTKLEKTLKSNLTDLPTPTEITDIETFDRRLKTLNDTIQNAITKHVKLTKPSPYMKRWWTSELTTKKKKNMTTRRKIKVPPPQQATPNTRGIPTATQLILRTTTQNQGRTLGAVDRGRG